MSRRQCLYVLYTDGYIYIWTVCTAHDFRMTNFPSESEREREENCKKGTCTHIVLCTIYPERVRIFRYSLASLEKSVVMYGCISMRNINSVVVGLASESDSFFLAARERSYVHIYVHIYFCVHKPAVYMVVSCNTQRLSKLESVVVGALCGKDVQYLGEDCVILCCNVTIMYIYKYKFMCMYMEENRCRITDLRHNHNATHFRHFLRSFQSSAAPRTSQSLSLFLSSSSSSFFGMENKWMDGWIDE
jgi:hypothetical protein